MSYRKYLMPSDMSSSVAYAATAVDSDTISRRAAIDAAIKGADSYYADSIKEEINNVPPAQSKRGKWIKISPANIYECSECGKSVMTNDICAYDFCHGCGAEMEVTT